ncbi:MAG: phosphopyruvate hydratase [Candidatus Micrarchaeota archaeon]
MIIREIKARQVLDSRGTPTIEAEVNGFRAIAPSGASVGASEVKELRDNKKAFFGKSVSKAVDKARKLALKLESKNFSSILEFDEFLKKEGKNKLGGNTTIALSTAFCKAFAANQGISTQEVIAVNAFGRARLPCPAANLINGGLHANNGLFIQEHLLFPFKTKTFFEATQCVAEVYHELKKIIQKKYNNTGIGDEGGFAPRLKSPKDAFKLIEKAVEETGWSKKVFLGVDCAASSFWKNNKYAFHGKRLSTEKLKEEYEELSKEFKIKYFEDPFQENDFSAFAAFMDGKKLVVGDDLTVTNKDLIKKAVEEHAIKGVIIKPNQIGLVTEAIDASKEARKAGLILTASHRSGDSEDFFLSDFSSGLSVEFLKLGAPVRGERTAKYNELLRLEEAGTPYFHY